ncbi:cytochrome c [Aquabacterium sp. J223]|nr:cytochrome c [Aquabacterium sp. J223]UUX97894.1 cytochrome c [Aquabacterium sp. J223]
MAAVAVWTLRPAPGAGPRLRPDDAALVERGRQVYAQHCAACHGARLEGQADWRSRGADGLLPAPPHDASGHTWHHPDAQLIAITKLGVAKAAGLSDYRSAMPAYEGVLGDEDIVAVLSFIKAQWPPAIRAKHDEVNAAAR